MKKIDNKLVIVDAKTDFEVMFAQLGELGYSFRSIVPTPFGMKMYFERTSDEDVSPELLEIDRAAALAKKWGG